MPIYNVLVTLETTMVVVADDEDHAYQVAQKNAREALDEGSLDPDVNLLGEVTSTKHLHSGWDGNCLPYGGDGKTMLRDLLKPNRPA